MNRAQKAVVLAGVAAVALMLLVPPWSYIATDNLVGYMPLFGKGVSNTHIDFPRLGVQCAAVAVLAFGAFVALWHKKD